MQQGGLPRECQARKAVGSRGNSQILGGRPEGETVGLTYVARPLTNASRCCSGAVCRCLPLRSRPSGLEASGRLVESPAPRSACRYNGWDGFARCFGRLRFAALVAGCPRRLRGAAARSEPARPRDLGAPIPRVARCDVLRAARLGVVVARARLARVGVFSSARSSCSTTARTGRSCARGAQTTCWVPCWG